MSNPYDFTSGFLTAKSLIETERKNKADETFRRDVMGPYYQSATKENNEKSGYYGVLKRDKILEQNVKRAKGIDMFGWDPLSDYTDDNPFGFTYTPMQPAQVDPANPAGGVKVPPPKLANGTPGGINLSGSQPKDALLDDSQQGGDVVLADASGVNQRRQAINLGGGTVVSDASPVASSAAPSSSASQSMRDPVNILKDENPKAANAIAMNFFTAPMKDIPKMLDKVSKWDLFEGKISSKDVLANVQAMKTMQNEGVAQAMSLALQGNKKAAMKLFSEIGSDLGEDVADLTPIKIKNPVAGVIKGVNDEYDGIQIKYKDGSTMNWDPRKFLISTASLKEYITSKDTVENNLRSQAASKYGDDVRAETNRLNRELRMDQLDEQDRQKRLKQVSDEALADLRGKRNAFLDPKNPSFIADDEQRAIASDKIDAEAQQAATIAQANINFLGNKNVSYLSTLQAIKANKVARDAKTGQPVTKVSNGVTYVMTPYNVWIPAPQAAQPQQ